MKISVVIPVYNSEKTLEKLVGRLSAVLSSLGPFEIILVDDGSRDQSYSIAKRLAQAQSSVKFIALFKNFGQIGALFAGMSQVEGEVCVIMDDDLQNPPEEIPKLLQKLTEENYDFVYGFPETMKQAFWREMGSRFTNKMSEFLFDKPATLYPTTFIAMRAAVVREVIRYDGPYPYLAGQIFRFTHRGCNVVVRHEARKHGRSQYNLKKLLKLWLNGMTNFSIIPLRVSTGTGVVAVGIGFLYLMWLLIQKIFFHDFLEGWLSLVGVVVILSGLQLIFLGVLGEYIGRIFMFLNRTPQYVIRETFNCARSTESPP
jgi:glycosyltransferase involved in cell wall biosynthesis